MQNTKPFFSIIIPAYNVEKYIARSISSVLSQSFKDFEIIIVNDGSVDKTADIIDSYAKKTEKINVINHVKNESQHVSRMDGVAASNGQYILFLDADDYFTNSALTILYDEVQKKPGYDFYEFGYIRQPSRKKTLPSFKGEDRFSAFFTRDKYPVHTMWDKVYEINLLKKSFSLMEREYINNTEDLYESIVIAYYAKKIFKVEKIIINYTINTGISTTYKDYDKTVAFINVSKKGIDLIRNFLKLNNQNIDLSNLTYNLIRRIMQDIYLQKRDEEKKKLLLMLTDYFDSKLILECLYYRHEAITNSMNYKLGQKILNPFRKLKNLFNLYA
jgi:glycosyltransferase involved in cell wall biosynthesis